MMGPNYVKMFYMSVMKAGG